jgi:type IV pilus assembly protein PilE
MHARRQRGFSLVELMVTVAILAVISSLAVSAYSGYTRRAHRTEARIALLSIQTAQEKWFLQNNAYAQSLATLVAAPPAGLGLNLTSTGLTPNSYYQVSFTAATATTYTVRAAAYGAQTADTACLAFTISDSGARTPAESTGCWR